ncbi:unnamed protein product [Ixodes pacificus]
MRLHGRDDADGRVYAVVRAGFRSNLARFQRCPGSPPRIPARASGHYRVCPVVAETLIWMIVGDATGHARLRCSTLATSCSLPVGSPLLFLAGSPSPEFS